jgi:predicted  nucleic acid-binding Zn-ribbon protein
MAESDSDELARMVADGFKEMRDGFTAIDERFSSIDERFSSIDKRFGSIDERFDAVDQRFDGMEQRFDGMERRFDGMERRFDAVEGRLVAVEVGQEALRHDIQTVAEGQASLREAMERGFAELREEMKDELSLDRLVLADHARRITSLEDRSGTGNK